jgi:hypothetical protein
VTQTGSTERTSGRWMPSAPPSSRPSPTPITDRRHPAPSFLTPEPLQCL